MYVDRGRHRGIGLGLSKYVDQTSIMVEHVRALGSLAAMAPPLIALRLSDVSSLGCKFLFL